MPNDTKRGVVEQSHQSFVREENDPQLSNTGVMCKKEGEFQTSAKPSKPSIHRYSIDWIAYTAPGHLEPRAAVPGREIVLPENDPLPTEMREDGYVYSLPDLDSSVRNAHPVQNIPDECFIPSGEKVRPFPRYTHAEALLGARVDWNVDDPKQGIFVSMTGQDCQYCRLQGLDLSTVLSHALYWVRGDMARLDFAVDIFADVDIDDLSTAWAEGRIKTPARQFEPVKPLDQHGKPRAHGVNFGSRFSGRYVRVYDKGLREEVAAERVREKWEKMTGREWKSDAPPHWIRVEVETKGEWANALAKSMLISSIIPAGKAFIRDFLQVEGVPWYTSALSPDSDDEIWLEPIERKLSDRQRWYRDQIIPAIVSDLRTDSGWLRALLLDALEIDYSDDALRPQGEHGGALDAPKPLSKRGRKFRGAVRLLARLGLASGIHRLGFVFDDEEDIYSIAARLGYAWDTKEQDWVE